MGDKSGYELTFTATEKGLAKLFTADVDSTFSVTVGA
jgi:hypothetical protein